MTEHWQSRNDGKSAVNREGSTEVSSHLKLAHDHTHAGEGGAACGGGCHHHDHKNADSRRLAIALLIIGAFAIAEVIGGILSNSLALIADSGHMVTDAVAIGLALWARYLAQAPATAKLPYGRSRAQVLAAFVNGIALFVLIGALFRESLTRIAAPEAINAGLMLTIAVIGLGANIAAFAVLHAGDRKDINMRGALLHVVGDMLGSVAAIISAIVISLTSWRVIDPLVTLIVCALIARSAYYLTRDAAHVLLQGAPPDMDVNALRQDILNTIEEIDDIHDLKVWMLTPNDTQLTMHVRLRSGEETNSVLQAAKAFLTQKHGISDSIIQIETAVCDDPVRAADQGETALCPDQSMKQKRRAELEIQSVI